MGVSRRSYAAQRLLGGSKQSHCDRADYHSAGRDHWRRTWLLNWGIPTRWRVSPGPCQDRMGHYRVQTEIRVAVPKRQQEMKAPTVRSINGDSRARPVRTGRPLRARYCAVGSMQSQLTIDLMQIGIWNADQAAQRGPPRRRFRSSKTIFKIQDITHGVHTSCTPEHVRLMNRLQFPSTPPLAKNPSFTSEIGSFVWGRRRLGRAAGKVRFMPLCGPAGVERLANRHQLHEAHQLPVASLVHPVTFVAQVPCHLLQAKERGALELHVYQQHQRNVLACFAQSASRSRRRQNCWPIDSLGWSGSIILPDIPQVACLLTSRSPDCASRSSVFRPERHLWSRKRLKLCESGRVNPQHHGPTATFFSAAGRPVSAAFVQFWLGSRSCT